MEEILPHLDESTWVLLKTKNAAFGLAPFQEPVNAKLLKELAYIGIEYTFNNFNLLNRRQDVGELWENYLVMERLKKQQYKQIWSRNFFWRTYDQKELDWVEEREGKLFGYEFKWKNPIKAPKLWLETYPQALFECIHSENYLPFIL